jgi:hypothetical protein
MHPLPFTRRLLLRPDISYLAQSAILSRLTVSGARIWMNRPAGIQKPGLSEMDKRQAFGERVMIEAAGTPIYMLLMHLVPDATAWTFDRVGWMRPQLKLPQLAPAERDTVHQALHAVTGRRYVLGKLLFEEKATTYGAVLEKLKPSGLADNPSVQRALEGWFRRSRLLASVSLLNGIVLGGIVFGGFVLQQFNDRLFAPWLAARLRKPPDHATANPTP